MGSVGAIVSIPNHELNNGFDMDVFSMSGSADVRNTQSSAGTYSQASGGANVFLTNSFREEFYYFRINTSGIKRICNCHLVFIKVLPIQPDPICKYW